MAIPKSIQPDTSTLWKKSYIAILAFLMIISILFFSGIAIPLDSFDRRLESLLGHILDRDVTIQGPVKVKLCLQPVLEFNSLTIADPRDWSDGKNFLVVEKAKGQLDLLPLIQGDFHINDLELEGVDLRLVTRIDQTSNYRFGSSDNATEAGQSNHEFWIFHISLGHFENKSTNQQLFPRDSNFCRI